MPLHLTLLPLPPDYLSCPGNNWHIQMRLARPILLLQFGEIKPFSYWVKWSDYKHDFGYGNLEYTCGYSPDILEMMTGLLTWILRSFMKMNGTCRNRKVMVGCFSLVYDRHHIREYDGNSHLCFQEKLACVCVGNSSLHPQRHRLHRSALMSWPPLYPWLRS